MIESKAIQSAIKKAGYTGLNLSTSDPVYKHAKEEFENIVDLILEDQSLGFNKRKIALSYKGRNVFNTDYAEFIKPGDLLRILDSNVVIYDEILLVYDPSNTYEYDQLIVDYFYKIDFSAMPTMVQEMVVNKLAIILIMSFKPENMQTINLLRAENMELERKINSLFKDSSPKDFWGEGELVGRRY